MTDQGEAGASTPSVGSAVNVGRTPEVGESASGDVIGVGIVDDDAGFAATLASYLELDPAFVIVGIADSVEAGRELVADPRAELVLIDVNMPDGGGVALVHAVSPDPATRPAMMLISAQEPTDEVRSAPVDFASKHDIDHAMLRGVVGLDRAS